MALDTGTAILILGAFVLPGFITLTLRERLYIVRGEDTPFERLLSAPPLQRLAASAILVLLPSLIALLGSRWMASRRLRPQLLRLAGSSEAHTTRSAWNQIFDEQGPCLIRANLTDGRIVGGLYDESGLAGYSEEVPDLYLCQRWDLDGDLWFLGPAEHSLGIWLPSGSIASLEIFDVEGVSSLKRETPKIRS
jgi:hypothetical protein